MRIVPVVSQLVLTLAVGPNVVITIEGWRVSDLRLRNVCTITTQIPVIGELFPWNGMVMNANAEKAPEGHINIEDPPTHLLNQQPLMVPIRLPL